MGVHYRIIKGDKVIRKDKKSWPYFSVRKGYELQLRGDHYGWRTIGRGKS